MHAYIMQKHMHKCVHMHTLKNSLSVLKRKYATEKYTGQQCIPCRGHSPLPLWGATLRQKLASQKFVVTKQSFPTHFGLQRLESPLWH